MLASALAKIGDSAAEPALLSLLERGDEKLKIAAVDALGRVGTRSAVESLMDLTGSLFGSELERSAREAIARIQSRLGDVEAGRLSVAEIAEQEGALSISREGGELSLSNEENDKPPDTEKGSSG